MEVFFARHVFHSNLPLLKLVEDFEDFVEKVKGWIKNRKWYTNFRVLFVAGGFSVRRPCLGVFRHWKPFRATKGRKVVIKGRIHQGGEPWLPFFSGVGAHI